MRPQCKETSFHAKKHPHRTHQPKSIFVQQTSKATGTGVGGKNSFECVAFVLLPVRQWNVVCTTLCGSTTQKNTPFRLAQICSISEQQQQDILARQINRSSRTQQSLTSVRRRQTEQPVVWPVSVRGFRCWAGEPFLRWVLSVAVRAGILKPPTCPTRCVI